MNKLPHERLYPLLPAFLRLRDAEQGEPLHALLAAFEAELQRIEDDMDAMYDNWFINTCDRWVIPYIGDLLGIDDLQDSTQLIIGQRRRVANTLTYRRRKGTLSIVEHALADVTDWGARVTEYQQQLATTISTRQQPQRGGGKLIDVASLDEIARLNTPFDRSAHTLDVRLTRCGPRYNPASVGVYLWRLRAYPLADVQVVRNRAAGCFVFHPLGLDTQLFNAPQPIEQFEQRAGPTELPLPLTRAAFAADLEQYAQRYAHIAAADRPPNTQFYGPDRGLFLRYWDGTCICDISPMQVVSADLSAGRALPASSSAANNAPVTVAIDVATGRFRFAGAQPDENEVFACYTYGFSNNIGGGPYERDIAIADPQTDMLHIFVAKAAAARPPDFEHKSQGILPTDWREREELAGLAKRWVGQANTLQGALALWDDFCKRRTDPACALKCVIQFLDNRTYGGNLDGGNLTIHLPEGADLSLIAADGCRPAIRPVGDIVIAGAAAKAQTQAAAVLGVALAVADTTMPPKLGELAPSRRLLLDGLLLDGALSMRAQSFVGQLQIDIQHCTIRPGQAALKIDSQVGQALQLSLQQCIVGSLQLPAQAHTTITDSIIDARSGLAISGSVLRLKRTTVFGAVAASTLALIQDALITGRLHLPHSSGGRIRYSYLHPHSLNEASAVTAPQRENVLQGCGPDGAEIQPIFSSTRYGDPNYAQLSQQCPRAILTGGSDGSELGAFSSLYQNLRTANIRSILQEHLPFGLSAEVIFVT